MWLSISFLGLLLLSLLSQTGGRSVLAEIDDDEKIERMVSRVRLEEEYADLRFPEGFYRAENDIRLSYSDFVDEMHELAWMMCDQYRKIETRLENRDYHGFLGRQFLLFQLQSNPMEPRFHYTCLSLFTLYPNMEERLRDKKMTDLIPDSSGEAVHYDVPF